LDGASAAARVLDSDSGAETPELDFSFTRVAARIPNPNYPVSAIIFGNQYN